MRKYVVATDRVGYPLCMQVSEADVLKFQTLNTYIFYDAGQFS